MKFKSIFLIGICSLFFVSGLLAQNGDRVYVKVVFGLQKCDIWTYKADKFEKTEIPAPFWDKKGMEKGEGFTDMSRFLEKYFKEGYKLISSTPDSKIIDYIFEKE